MLLISGFFVVAAKNPVHSVLLLILAFFNAAGLFVLVGAEFLAMLLVIVYVGAVAVLFLFVVMMLNVNTEESRKGYQRYLPYGVIVAIVLYLEIVYAFKNGLGAHTITPKITDAIKSTDIISNTHAIGEILYTKYALLFQLSGLVLFVAMIGAIVLTLEPRKNIRKQIIAQQNARKPSETMEIVKVKTGEGIK